MGPSDSRQEDKITPTINSRPLSQLQSLVQKLQQVQERLAELEVTASSVKLDGRKRNRTGDHPRVCHKCKQPGHYARFCAPSRQKPSVNQERTHQTLSVNSVTSYYLQGYVCNESISFLVDTGAGVSLLSGKVWDKIKPSTVSLEPNQCQNIVGVDGHSIQVRGSVKIPVTISDRTFEQTFIIADKITAERILGMDFLEGNKCVFDVAKREITFENLEPLSLVPPAPSLTAAVSNVALDKTITIPAACEIETMAQLPSAGGPWLVEGKKRSDVLVARAVVTPLRKFNVMPFGLCNAPATFQRLMNSVLAGLQWTSCLVYIDDIIIVGKNFDEHLDNLHKVLKQLKQANLKVQPHKCQFLQQRVVFLGHVISPNGIAPDPDKTSKVKQWPIPSSKVEVQQFLGFSNYYRRFVKDFASIAKPLHQLTEKKSSFCWTNECQVAFDHLKQCLTSAPTLVMANWSSSFIIDTDASDTGIGAVLSQTDEKGTEHVIAYASRLLSKAEHNYCTTRKELLAVITFLQHFRQYLLGRLFTVQTDHGALTWLQGFKNPEGQLARWLEKLQEYQFNIVHRPGKKHMTADALSRLPCRQCGRTNDIQVAMLTSGNTSCGYSPQQLRSMQLDDDCIGQILRAKEQEQQPSTNFAKSQPISFRRLLQQWDQLITHDGVLYRLFHHHSEEHTSLQLVAPTVLREEIVKEMHEGVASGHLGQDKTLHRLKERFYWPGHYNDVRDWCQTCATCASRKMPTHSSRSPLGSISASYPTQIMAVDLVGPLPESDSGNVYIMVVGDYFSRWMEAIPVPNQEARTVAEKLVEVFLRFSAQNSCIPIRGDNSNHSY